MSLRRGFKNDTNYAEPIINKTTVRDIADILGYQNGSRDINRNVDIYRNLT